MTNDNNEWLTVREAAKLSDYNPESITRLIRAGKISAKKVSIVWLVNRKSLLEYLGRVKTLGEKRGRKPENWM